MLTPKLEQLIWEGKAWFKTKVVGGTNKFNLPIQEDRFIIITDLTYQSSLILPDGQAPTYENILQFGVNTQLTIIGERSFNRYVFRNSFNIVNAVSNLIAPIGSVKVDCYLAHTTNVTFSFSRGQNLKNQVNNLALFNTASLKPPVDYGKDGDPGALNSVISFDSNQLAPAFTVNTQSQYAEGVNNANELSFPVQDGLILTDVDLKDQYSYPILLVNYVEILGQPNNLGI